MCFLYTTGLIRDIQLHYQFWTGVSSVHCLLTGQLTQTADKWQLFDDITELTDEAALCLLCCYSITVLQYWCPLPPVLVLDLFRCHSDYLFVMFAKVRYVFWGQNFWGQKWTDTVRFAQTSPGYNHRDLLLRLLLIPWLGHFTSCHSHRTHVFRDIPTPRVEGDRPSKMYLVTHYSILHYSILHRIRISSTVRYGRS